MSLTSPGAATDGDYWANSSSEYAAAASGLHYLQIDLGAKYRVDKIKVWHYANDGRTYHNTKTQVSSDGVSWFTVFDSAVSGEYPETAAGKTHTFTARSVRYIRDYLNGNTVNAYNHWVELEGLAPDTSTTYLGNYFEWNGSTSTMVKYYYAAGVRVAMRVGSNNPYFLLLDHLGSTHKILDISGTALTGLYYKAWGESRYSTGSLSLTSFKFTGQREESVLGLYFYLSRWYDPALARFTSPDTIMPDLSAAQSWDRMAYVRNNPLRYTDPTGHMHIAEGPNNDRFSRWKANQYISQRDRYVRKQNSISNLVKVDNPNIYGMVAAGTVLTLGILITEGGLVLAESATAPIAVATPLIGVPIEIGLIGISLFLVDVDVAYWSYVYRTYQAGEKQTFEWFYPWGLP
jgi:RHS repeat-associated protein